MRSRLPALLLVVAAMTLVHEPSRADGVSTEQLRAAVKRGAALPLSELRRALGAAYAGEIIDVDVDEDDGRFRYEFKVLQASGRVIEVKMDAATGAILDVEND